MKTTNKRELHTHCLTDKQALTFSHLGSGQTETDRQTDRERERERDSGRVTQDQDVHIVQAECCDGHGQINNVKQYSCKYLMGLGFLEVETYI